MQRYRKTKKFDMLLSKQAYKLSRMDKQKIFDWEK